MAIDTTQSEVATNIIFRYAARNLPVGIYPIHPEGGAGQPQSPLVNLNLPSVPVKEEGSDEDTKLRLETSK